MKRARAVAKATRLQVTPSCGCVFCDVEIELHEDARGFHHVIQGERIPCGLGANAVVGHMTRIKVTDDLPYDRAEKMLLTLIDESPRAEEMRRLYHYLRECDALLTNIAVFPSIGI